MAIDRPRGILSEADRRYLRNPEEYSKQARYERRRAIIDRVRESFHDYPLLVSALDEESRTEVFKEEQSHHEEMTLNVLTSGFAFLYLGILDTIEPRELGHQAFEDILGTGIKQAYHQQGYSVKNVDVNVEVDRGPPLRELKEKGELTQGGILQLLESGEMTAEEAAESLNELLREAGFEGEEIEPTDTGLKYPNRVILEEDPNTEE